MGTCAIFTLLTRPAKRTMSEYGNKCGSQDKLPHHPAGIDVTPHLCLQSANCCKSFAICTSSALCSSLQGVCLNSWKPYDPGTAGQLKAAYAACLDGLQSVLSAVYRAVASVLLLLVSVLYVSAWDHGDPNCEGRAQRSKFKGSEELFLQTFKHSNFEK